MGLQLQPFTLGHARLLMTIESPLMETDTELTLSDLWVAVYVCSIKSWSEAHKMLINGKAESEAKKHGDSFDLAELQQHKKAFRDYIDYYTEAPMRNDSEKHYARVPWPWLYSWLLLKDNVVKTQEEAWNTICSDAFAWNACRCAYNNDENLMNDLEVDFYLSE